MKNLISLTTSLVLVFASVNAYSSDVNTSVAQDAQSVTSTQFSQAELEQILAPIALYPDTILSHILVSATYPLEVIQAERWTVQNSDLEGSAAVEAVSEENWDPSVKALVAFPNVLKRLSENLDWTQKLGDAFLQNEENVLASVQSLRQRAYDEGSLDKMEKVSVTQQDNAISIAPLEKEVVYVPYYDTRVVYGSWFWPSYPPVYWGAPYYAGYNPGYYSPFYWGPSVYISYGYYFSAFNWGGHHLVRIPYHSYNPHHYYSPYQIAGHGNARAWAHNPSHRRGVSYRSVTVSNRYSARNTSQRASQAEVRAHRSNVSVNTSNRNSNIRSSHSANASSRNNQVTTSAHQRSTTRIASPARIREELRDGRISLEERSSRPVNNTNRSSTRSTTASRTNHNQQANSHRQPAQKPAVRGEQDTSPNRERPQNSQLNVERSQPATTVTPQPTSRSSNTRNSNSRSSSSSTHSRAPSSSHSSKGSSSRSSSSRSRRSKDHNR